jgi:hypothetical protein
MLLTHESPEVLSSSSSGCPLSTVATPTGSPVLKKPSRGMSMQELNEIFEHNLAVAPHLQATSSRTIVLDILVTFAVVLLPLAACLYLGFATLGYLGTRVDANPKPASFLSAALREDSALGWNHKPVVSPSCRVARKYIIDPRSPAVASWVLDCEVPGFGATIDGNHPRITDVLRALSHMLDQIFQAQALTHRFHRELGALASNYEFPISLQSISASTMDLLIDAMVSYYVQIHKMLCHIRDKATETLTAEARVAPYTLTWYNNKIYHDIEDNISILETAETTIRGRHTECREIMWLSYAAIPTSVLFSEWNLTDDLENVLKETWKLLEQIDESIKTASATLKSVQKSMIVVDSDSQEGHRVNHIQISNLLVDVEDTLRISSDMVTQTEGFWQNSTSNK